ncbi:hypothetical protein ABIE50_003421 [Chitinophaga sp. OAE865]
MISGAVYLSIACNLDLARKTSGRSKPLFIFIRKFVNLIKPLHHFRICKYVGIVRPTEQKANSCLWEFFEHAVR